MKRGDFIKSLGLIGIAMTDLKNWMKEANELSSADKIAPAIFLGHGSPMNAVADNAFTRSLTTAGTTIPKPKAILIISAHWLSRGGTFVSSTPKPEMIYDMYGFPDELYKINYPSPGAPELAKETQALLSAQGAKEDPTRGIDHGVWSVLRHLYPAADVPVYCLSIDWGKSLDHFYEIGQAIAALRKKGVMIVGSGNIVHNLGIFDWEENAKPVDWALEFDSKVKSWLDSNDDDAVKNYQSLGALARTAHPTNDHYLPLLFVLGSRTKGEKMKYIYEGIMNGTISMRCVQFG